MKALLWKEYKEIHWIFLCVLGGTLGLALLAHFMSFVGFSVFTLFFLVIYTVFIGARGFTSEKEKGNYDYLHTLPVTLGKVLVIKYVLGIIQIIIMGILTYFLAQFDHGLQYIFNQFPFTYMSNTLCIVTLLIFYTVCFQVSLFTGDTIRTVIIGVPITVILIVLMALGIFILGITSFIMSPGLYSLQILVYFISLWILLMGILGISYYSLSRKRLVWKTGYLGILLLPVLILFYSDREFHGTIKPLSINQTIYFNQPDLFIQNNQLYGLGILYDVKRPGIEQSIIKQVFSPAQKRNTVKPTPMPYQIIQVDIHNPNNIKASSITHIPYSPDIKYDEDYAYALIKDTSDKYRVSVYDLKKSENSNVICNIPLPLEASDSWIKGKPPTLTNTFSLREHTIRLENNQLYLTYGILTSKIINSITFQYGIPTDSSLYKLHTLVYDKSSWKMVNEFDEPFSPFVLDYRQDYRNYSYLREGNKINIYFLQDTKLPLKVSSLDFPINKYDIISLNYKIYENRLFVSSPEHPLEIYDLTDPVHPKQIGSCNWDWLDRKAMQNYNFFTGGKVGVSGNRAIVFCVRGFIVFDISDPSHPRQLGKMNSDYVQSSAIDQNYIYTSGAFRGFSVYRIPE